MGETKEKVAPLLRSVLETFKDGIPVNNLQREYRILIGTPIQYQAMGFPTLETFLKALPEICFLERQPNGEVVCKAVIGDKSSHIQMLVAKTRTSKSRTKAKRKIRNFDNNFSFKRNSATKSFRHNNRENRPPMKRSPPRRYEQPPRFSRQSPNSYSRQDSGASSNINQQNPPLANSLNYGNKAANVNGVNPTWQKRQSSKIDNHQNLQNHTRNIDNSSKNQISLEQDPPVHNESAANDVPTTSWNSLKANDAGTISPIAVPSVPNSRVPTPYKPQSYTVTNRVITPEASISPEPTSPTLVEPKTCRQMVENYAIIKGTIAKFKTLPVPRKRTGKTYYLSTLTLLGNEYRSYPADKNTEEEANEEAAKNAVEELKLREMKALKVLPVTPSTTEEELSVMVQRLLRIVEPKNNGIWHSNAQKEFEKLYGEKLPITWLNILKEKHFVRVETITGDSEEVNRFILYPSLASSGDRSTPSSPLMVTEPFSSYPADLVYPDDNQWDVYVCHVEEDSTNICIRLIEYATEFEELANKMNDFYKRAKKPVHEITIGEFYCAEDEGSFHRIRIEVVQNNSVFCHFVDHGDYLLIDINSVFELHRQFLELPCQAILCELTGIEYLYCDPGSTENLIALTLDKSFVAEITNRDDILSLVLFDTSTEEDININQKVLEKALSTSLKPHFPDSEVGVACLTHVYDNGDIYLKPEAALGVRVLNDLVKDNTQIFEECLQTSPLSRVSLSNMYVTKKKNLWRRVLLVSEEPKPGTRDVEITYVDYGNTDTIPIQSLVEINSICDILVKLPRQLLRCRMNEVPSSKELQWTVRAKNKLLQMVPDNDLLSVKVVPNTEAGTQDFPEVHLFKKNERNELISINQTLTFTPDIFDSSCKTEKSSEKSFAPLKRPSSITLRSQRNSQSSLLSPTFLASPSPLSTSLDISGGTLNLAPLVPVEIPQVGQYMDVLVQTAANPNTFFVHARSESLIYNNLFDKMQEFYNMDENILDNNMDLIKPCLFYAVKNNQDGLWYRGWVSQIVSNDPVFIVIYLVDYGEFIQQGDLTSIQTLYSQFRTIPMQAIKAKLAGVEGINGDYEIHHITFFQDLVQNKAFVAKIEAKEKDTSISLNSSIVTLTLIDTATPADVYISNLLIDKGFAKAIV